MTDGNPYGYDPATDTVRVGRHDLARLLLQFRDEVERPGRSSPWSHMHDYDKSFERLADAVDYARSAAPYRTDRGPDYRMRCKRGPAYDCPVWRRQARERAPAEMQPAMTPAAGRLTPR